jgi:SSS family solute:Na+ symporter
MALLPTGIKGLVFAALLAAIVSSLASMCNSISTIFHRRSLPSMVSKEWLDRNLVFSGRLTALVAMAIAMAAAQPLLGNFDQAFQYIQEFTGFFTPGIVAIFLLGMFWGKTTATGALLAAVGSAVLSLAMKLLLPALPFIDRVGIVFLLCVAIAVVWSLARPQPQPGYIEPSGVSFATSTGFNAAAVVVTCILTFFYVTLVVICGSRHGFALVCAVAVLAFSESTLADPAHCKPTLVENFEDKLDPTVWRTVEGDGCDIGLCGWGNNEVQHYADQAVRVVDGVLSITVAEKDGRITSGKLVSEDLFHQQYGRFEARINLPSGRGLWPAFWMMPQGDSPMAP